jgi:hypothetical protein
VQVLAKGTGVFELKVPSFYCISIGGCAMHPGRRELHAPQVLKLCRSDNWMFNYFLPLLFYREG